MRCDYNYFNNSNNCLPKRAIIDFNNKIKLFVNCVNYIKKLMYIGKSCKLENYQLTGGNQFIILFTLAMKLNFLITQTIRCDNEEEVNSLSGSTAVVR